MSKREDEEGAVSEREDEEGVVSEREAVLGSSFSPWPTLPLVFGVLFGIHKAEG